MKRIVGAALALLLMGQAPAPTGVAGLGWMSGGWLSESDGRWTEETWLPPRGGVMLGVSRSGREDVLREFEYIRIQAGADGVPVYHASPGGRTPVGFRLVASDGASATFENPQHDYPQRIHYRRDGDSMVATISALDGSNAMRWTYRRR